jgi:hypothetical protein
VFIEDKLENYTALWANGTPCHLVARPWNRGTSATRVGSIFEAVDHILGTTAESITPENGWTRQDVGVYTKEIRVTSASGAQKGTKPERFDLIPAEALAIVARHYGVGAQKYSPWNWRKGYEWSLSSAALQRHLNAWQSGENTDEETGSPHMAAIAFHALALLTFEIEHPELDDRWTAVKDVA